MKIADLLADPTLPVCSSGKRPHRTEADARATLGRARAQQRGDSARLVQRRPGHVQNMAYLCEACRCWHLASSLGKPGRRQGNRKGNRR